MPTVGNYVTFGDADVTLQIGSDIDNTYPPIRVDGTLDLGAAILGRWPPTTWRWRVAVNGAELRTYTNNGDQFGTIQETFGGRVLNDGDKSLMRIND